MVEQWRAGDDGAARRLFERYEQRLARWLRRRIDNRLASRLDAEDVAMSAYRSFFTALREGRIGVTTEEGLWPILVTIAARKLIRQQRFHFAGRRSIRQEESQKLDNSADFATVTGTAASPVESDFRLALDDLPRWIDRLEPALQAVVRELLAGASTSEISRTLKIQERQARRLKQRAIDALAKIAGQSLSEAGSTGLNRSAIETTLETLVGTVHYREVLLEQLVGAGAFCKVYRGKWSSHGAPIAIKFLKRECWSDPRTTRALAREYEILKDLVHPSLLRAHGWGTTPAGGFFLVTDFIAGGSLQELRERSPLSISQALDLARMITEGIMAAHAAGVLHGDLKPANILMKSLSEPVLADFGFARWSHSPEDVPRGGTAPYLAPEQLSAAFGGITERTDVYGLGALLYDLLTGVPPMLAQTLPETIDRVLSNDGPVAASQLNWQVPKKLDALLAKCLAKNPAERWASAREIAAEMEQIRWT